MNSDSSERRLGRTKIKTLNFYFFKLELTLLKFYQKLISNLRITNCFGQKAFLKTLLKDPVDSTLFMVNLITYKSFKIYFSHRYIYTPDKAFIDIVIG